MALGSRPSHVRRTFPVLGFVALNDVRTRPLERRRMLLFEQLGATVERRQGEARGRRGSPLKILPCQGFGATIEVGPDLGRELLPGEAQSVAAPQGGLEGQRLAVGAGWG